MVWISPSASRKLENSRSQMLPPLLSDKRNAKILKLHGDFCRDSRLRDFRSSMLHSSQSGSLRYRDDLTVCAKHDQWSTLILDPRVMSSPASNHPATSLDPTVLAASQVLHGEFRPFDFFLENLCETTNVLPLKCFDLPSSFEVFKGVIPSEL
jgi:hypothetical protein